MKDSDEGSVALWFGREKSPTELVLQSARAACSNSGQSGNPERPRGTARHKDRYNIGAIIIRIGFWGPIILYL